MKSLIEEVSLNKLGILLNEYNMEKDIIVDYNLLHMLNKGKKELYRLYAEGIELKIVVKKVSVFTTICANDIKEIFPLEASYILSYIVNNTNIDQSKNIKVVIYDESSLESLFYMNALNTAVNINLTFDSNSISPVAMDEYYKVNKNLVSNAKTTFFGTMLSTRSSKYMAYKPNDTNFPLSIEDLKKESKKNYLMPKKDEVAIIYCPVCGEKKSFLYSEVNEYFSIKKDEVTMVCAHANSEHMYETPPHKIKIDAVMMNEIKRGGYIKEDIYMWVIMNRKPFGLFGK